MHSSMAGDVAILCRSNANIAQVAGALSRLGVKVAVEREGLARTPHVEIVMAAFRWTAVRILTSAIGCSQSAINRAPSGPREINRALYLRIRAHTMLFLLVFFPPASGRHTDC